MKRTTVLCTVSILLLALSLPAYSQLSGKIPRIGYLTIGGKIERPSEAFLEGLHGLGYVKGKNIIIEYRGDSERKESRLPELATDLVRLKVDVIVALDPPAARAAKNATKTIPIVIRSTGDPVEAGFVKSLARPGGNITGVTSVSSELYGKRLELLKDIVRGLSRVAVFHRTQGSRARNLKHMQNAAQLLGLEVQFVQVRNGEDFQNAFRTADKSRVQGLITIRNPFFNNHRKQIADLAIMHRLPAIYDERAYVEDNGLMSYGTNLTDLHRHAAVFVDKILKGRKPADLPVEQPTKFEFVINLKAAKAIGLTIPTSVLARADRVIR